MLNPSLSVVPMSQTLRHYETTLLMHDHTFVARLPIEPPRRTVGLGILE